MRTARLSLRTGPGRQSQGHQVRELASAPLAQVSPLGGVELTPGSWGAPDRQGPTKQLVTITNRGFEQWMQLFTRTLSKSLWVPHYYACLVALSFWGWRGCDLTGTVVSRAAHVPRANALFLLAFRINCSAVVFRLVTFDVRWKVENYRGI